MRSLGPLPLIFSALVFTASFASAAQLSVNGGVLQFFRISVQIDDGGEKVAICHATASDTNPFALIEVNADGLDGHGAHPDDIIPAPEGATTDEDCVTAETLAGEITQPGTMSTSAFDPTLAPTASPETTPTASSSASATPSVSPSPTPETEPTPAPTPAETEEPSEEPTASPEPTPEPTAEPTPEPTAEPTPDPSP